MIVVGDFLEKSKKLNNRKFDVVIADPPYNIGKDFGNDSDKRSHETILCLWKGNRPHLHIDQIRERWFVCRDCDNQIFPPDKLRQHEAHNIFKHPTQKPMKLTKRLIMSCVNGGGGNVLIPFVGSGSECVVAKELGLDFFGCEINEEYVSFAQKWLAQKKEVQLCIN